MLFVKLMGGIMSINNLTKKQMKDIFRDLDNQIYFKCMHPCEWCIGNCSKCSDYAVDKESYENAKKEVLKTYFQKSKKDSIL